MRFEKIFSRSFWCNWSCDRPQLAGLCRHHDVDRCHRDFHIFCGDRRSWLWRFQRDRGFRWCSFNPAGGWWHPESCSIQHPFSLAVIDVPSLGYQNVRDPNPAEPLLSLRQIGLASQYRSSGPLGSDNRVDDRTSDRCNSGVHHSTDRRPGRSSGRAFQE